MTDREYSGSDECAWQDLRPPEIFFIPSRKLMEYLSTHPIRPGMLIPMDDPYEWGQPV